jgi:hypothetical protein
MAGNWTAHWALGTRSMSSRVRAMLSRRTSAEISQPGTAQRPQRKRRAVRLGMLLASLLITVADPATTHALAANGLETYSGKIGDFGPQSVYCRRFYYTSGGGMVYSSNSSTYFLTLESPTLTPHYSAAKQSVRWRPILQSWTAEGWKTFYRPSTYSSWKTATTFDAPNWADTVITVTVGRGTTYVRVGYEAQWYWSTGNGFARFINVFGSFYGGYSDGQNEYCQLLNVG